MDTRSSWGGQTPCHCACWLTQHFICQEGSEQVVSSLAAQNSVAGRGKAAHGEGTEKNKKRSGALSLLERMLSTEVSRSLRETGTD